MQNIFDCCSDIFGNKSYATKERWGDEESDNFR
jgi:hypothetical protein